jgi:putative phage-type endonuclease
MQPHPTISPDVDREAWLKERESGIGSSEAAAALGLSPWQSPLALYLRKIEPGGNPFEPTEAMRWGLRLEPLIAQAYSEETGAALALTQPFVRSTAHPFMFATLDAIREDGRLVEIKTVGERQSMRWGSPGTDDIPDYYVVQVLHQLAVTGAPVADVAALICGQALRIYTIERDDAAIQEIIEREGEFWERVQRRDPPEFDPDNDAHLLPRLFPEQAGDIEFDEQTTKLVEEWDVARVQASNAEQIKKRKHAEICAAFGNAASARLVNGRVLKRRIVRTTDRVQIVKAYEYVRLLWEKGWNVDE